MGDKSGIEWTDATWNPTTGCDQVSPGCDNCYALTLAKRLKAMGSAAYQNDGDPRTSGPGFKLTLHPDRLDQPLRWRKPRRVFVNSMSDLFHPDVPLDFIVDVWATMARTPQHTYQVLTKRPQRMARVVSDIRFDPEVSKQFIARVGEPMVYWPLSNVWLGTSIESDRYVFRAKHLRKTMAEVRFLSCEPLLGPLSSLDVGGLEWVIVGGESGPGARPMHRSWVRDIRDRCVDAGVPFFYKQAGAWASYTDGELHADRLDDGCKQIIIDRSGQTLGDDELCEIVEEPSLMLRVGKKAAGRELDGRTWDEFPIPDTQEDAK